MKQVPSIGRMVHYVLSQYDAGIRNGVGEHRPAIIVRVWDDHCVNLQVLLDSSNDTDYQTETALLWRTSAVQNEDEKPQGTWHWMEYVPAKEE